MISFGLLIAPIVVYRVYKKSCKQPDEAQQRLSASIMKQPDPQVFPTLRIELDAAALADRKSYRASDSSLSSDGSKLGLV